MKTMKQIDCPRFEDCSAPLCPLAENLELSIWYSNEHLCSRKVFQNLGWIKRQKAIVKVRAPEDRYFTVEMLEAIKQVRKGIDGISPDQPLEQARKAEAKWTMEKRRGRAIANRDSERCGVTRAKRSGLVAVAQASQQAKGGQK